MKRCGSSTRPSNQSLRASERADMLTLKYPFPYTLPCFLHSLSRASAYCARIHPNAFLKKKKDFARIGKQQVKKRKNKRVIEIIIKFRKKKKKLMK